MNPECNPDFPEVLRFEIGGYFGGYHVLEYKRGQLCYEPADGPIPHPQARRVIRPAPGQWPEFWCAIEAIGVWDWKPDYSTPDVCDGTSWSLDLSRAGRNLITRGDNGYPGGDGTEYSRKSAFGKFLHELERLTGVKGIR